MQIQTLDDGALRFARADGFPLQSVLLPHLDPACDWQELPASHEALGIHIDPNTAVTRWAGESMDYGFALEGLLIRASRGSGTTAQAPFSHVVSAEDASGLETCAPEYAVPEQDVSAETLTRQKATADSA